MFHMARTEGRRARRKFTDEFKASVVRLVLDEGKPAGAVARELKLTDSAVREWAEPGGTLPALQLIMGHSSIEMTQRYARPSDEAVMREAARIGEAGTGR